VFPSGNALNALQYLLTHLAFSKVGGLLKLETGSIVKQAKSKDPKQSGEQDKRTGATAPDSLVSFATYPAPLLKSGAMYRLTDLDNERNCGATLAKTFFKRRFIK
jgi:hypothetical protein